MRAETDFGIDTKCDVKEYIRNCGGISNLFHSQGMVVTGTGAFGYDRRRCNRNIK